MGFAGHVYDMIRRNRELRENMEVRRSRRKDFQEKFYHSSDKASKENHMTAEEWEKIRRVSNARYNSEKRYFFRYSIFYTALLIIITLLIGGVIWLFM